MRTSFVSLSLWRIPHPLLLPPSLSLSSCVSAAPAACVPVTGRTKKPERKTETKGASRTYNACRVGSEKWSERRGRGWTSTEVDKRKGGEREKLGESETKGRSVGRSVEPRATRTMTVARVDREGKVGRTDRGYNHLLLDGHRYHHVDAQEASPFISYSISLSYSLLPGSSSIVYFSHSARARSLHRLRFFSHCSFLFFFTYPHPRRPLDVAHDGLMARFSCAALRSISLRVHRN